MITQRKPAASLFVDRRSGQWVVRDRDGQFWLVPPVDDGWGLRRPYALSVDADLVSVPGHYGDVLGVPS